MKPKMYLMALLVIAALILAAGSVSAGPTASYDIPWWTVEGGGGDSSAGQYTLSGTVGQMDAGVLSGTGYRLSGGYWEGAQTQSKIYLPLAKR
jgi:hypothetical protein